MWGRTGTPPHILLVYFDEKMKNQNAKIMKHVIFTYNSSKIDLKGSEINFNVKLVGLNESETKSLTY